MKRPLEPSPPGRRPLPPRPQAIWPYRGNSGTCDTTKVVQKKATIKDYVALTVRLSFTLCAGQRRARFSMPSRRRTSPPTPFPRPSACRALSVQQL